MALRDRIAGFYSILDSNDEALARDLVTPIAQGGAGASVLQVRFKCSGAVSVAEFVTAARMARRITTEAGALLVVNDRIDIALAVDADGVHLGQDDLPLDHARALVRRLRPQPPFLIGVSTHNRAQVLAAVRGGADYIGFGPVYPTSTKIDPDPVQGLDELRAAVRVAGRVPVVAIGGITPARASEVAATGVAAACAISAVNQAENHAVAGSEISRAFTAARGGNFSV